MDSTNDLASPPVTEPTQSKFKNLIRNKRLIIPVVLFSFVVLATTIFLVVGKSPKPENSANTNQALNQNTPSQPKVKYNPLITDDDITKIYQSYQTKYEEQGKQYPAQVDYQFKYTLNSNLKEGSSLFLPNAYAASTSTCNIGSASDELPVYTLAAKIKYSEASALAKEFEITSDPASIPMDSGDDFQYYFADTQITKFLTIAEPSGTFYFHRPPKLTAATPIDLVKAKKLTDDELLKHKINEKLTPEKAKFDTSLDQYIFTYTKKLDSFDTVDKTSITNLGSGNSVCNVTATDSMNKVEVLVDREMGLSKLVNKTRKILSTYKLKRQTLEEALAEYADKTPIAPIVVGGGETTGAVNIDEATLVWFDYGEAYSQLAYIPIYLTSGKLASGTRVFTLFPAISIKELEKTSLPTVGETQTLHLDVFNPKPPSAKGTGQCYGNLVDYNVSCNAESQVICQGFMSIPVSTGDPWAVCKNGCQSKSAVFTPITSNPCKEFLERNDIDVPANTPLETVPGYQGGEVSCSVSGCPC